MKEINLEELAAETAEMFIENLAAQLNEYPWIQKDDVFVYTEKYQDIFNGVYATFSDIIPEMVKTLI